MTTTALEESVARRNPLIVATAEGEADRSDFVRAALRAAPDLAKAVKATPTLTFHEILLQISRAFLQHDKDNGVEDALDLAVIQDDLLGVVQRAVDTARDRTGVVVIDDAHLLHRAVLARVPTLLGVSADGRSLTVVLVGRPALDEVLRRPELENLASRIVAPQRANAPSPPAPATSIARPAARAHVPVRMRKLALLATAAILAIVTAILGARRLSEWRGAAASAPAQSPPPAPPAPLLQPFGGHSALSASQIDARLEELHRAAEQRATDMAARGDVIGLLELREQTQREYATLGANRQDYLDALLSELDVALERGRAERLRLDGLAMRAPR